MKNVVEADVEPVAGGGGAQAVSNLLPRRSGGRGRLPFPYVDSTGGGDRQGLAVAWLKRGVTAGTAQAEIRDLPTTVPVS